MEKYIIYNHKSNELIIKLFSSSEECEEFITNTLDLSLNYYYDKLEYYKKYNDINPNDVIVGHHLLFLGE